MSDQRDSHSATEQTAVQTEVPVDLRVTFSPPLWLQRRTWVLEVLREVGVTSILDIGCGEGSLLDVLCEPASTRPDHLEGTPKERTIDIHVTHIAGLDVSKEDLAYAVQATRPISEEESKDWREWDKPRPRWTDLRVDIWKGGLEVLNKDEVGWFGRKEWDAIVSTEVVEHVPQEILDVFFPTVLGVYQPPMLLLTTPNYNFNQLFSPPTPPGQQPVRASGYPDPTGQTDRVFRHHDHKREWREEEWKVWCEDGAKTWGYDVEFGGIGKMQEKDPWEREELAGKASLTAIFRRRPRGSEKRRKKALSMTKSHTAGGEKHELLATHYHRPHEMTGKPQSPEFIVSTIQRILGIDGELEYLKGNAAVEDIWQRREVSIACGGDLSLLLQIIEGLGGNGEWELVKKLPEDLHVWREIKWFWRVVWKAFVEREPEQESRDERQGSWPQNSEWPTIGTADDVEDPWATTNSSWTSSENSTLAEDWDIKGSERSEWQQDLGWIVDGGDWKLA